VIHVVWHPIKVKRSKHTWKTMFPLKSTLLSRQTIERNFSDAYTINNEISLFLFPLIYLELWTLGLVQRVTASLVWNGFLSV